MINLSVAIVKSHIYLHPQTCTALSFTVFCGAHSLKVQLGRLNFLMITVMRSCTARVGAWMKTTSVIIYDSVMDVSSASSEGKRKVRWTNFPLAPLLLVWLLICIFSTSLGQFMATRTATEICTTSKQCKTVLLVHVFLLCFNYKNQG